MQIVASVVDGRKRIFVHKSALINEYGWTHSLIRRFLPTPDKYGRNRHNRKRKSSLYFIDKVNRIQMTREFDSALHDTKMRRKGCAKAIETKRQRLAEGVRHLVVQVQFLEHDILVEKACEYLSEKIENDSSLRSFIIPPVNPKKLDKDFLDCILVDYIRHGLTTFSGGFGQLRGKPIKGLNVHERKKEKALGEIAKAYPFLSQECDRQIEAIRSSLTTVSI